MLSLGFFWNIHGISMDLLENHYALHNAMQTFILQETNISHLGKRNIIFKKCLARGQVVSSLEGKNFMVSPRFPTTFTNL